MPSGSVTTAFFRSEPAIPFGSVRPGSSMLMLKSKPEGESASEVVGWAWTCGVAEGVMGQSGSRGGTALPRSDGIVGRQRASAGTRQGEERSFRDAGRATTVGIVSRVAGHSPTRYVYRVDVLRLRGVAGSGDDVVGGIRVQGQVDDDGRRAGTEADIGWECLA